MTETNRTLPAQSAAAALSPASANPAVTRCWNAWADAYQAELAKSKNDVIASFRAAPAYRNAMPPLAGYENICDFIACTAHGILIGAIEGRNASKLLYAAQVALGTVRRKPSSREPGPA